MAAVIGRLFLYRVLAAIAEEEADLDGQLLTLQQEEMIRERARLPELEYIFKHELTREAAYNGLLKVQRRVFHRQVAEALERLYPDRLEEQVGVLAYHWERAGDAEKATEYLLQAADQARLAYAHEEAVGYYRRALAFLEETEAYDRAAQTQMKLGLTYDTAFDFQRSRQAYESRLCLVATGCGEGAARAAATGTSRPEAGTAGAVDAGSHACDQRRRKSHHRAAFRRSARAYAGFRDPSRSGRELESVPRWAPVYVPPAGRHRLERRRAGDGARL